MINVTKSYLPPIEEYNAYIERIWSKGWLTNNGPLLLELEAELKKYLGVKHLFFCTNGTIVLQLAIKALRLTGEVITTPFSYVATTTALLWENCTPVFADIDPVTLCVPAANIEALITAQTQAILLTHVYGIPCDVEGIEAIARKHNLKVIYDCAHGFGTVYKGRQLASYGDVSTLSFHATKLFHTIEGGAIITDDDEVASLIQNYRSFGHRKDEYFMMGINAKNSEFHAAMGLCVLPKVPSFIAARKAITELYDAELKGSAVQRPGVPPDTQYNYSYYPVLLSSEEKLMQVRDALEAEQIIPRRYFYPSLNRLPYLHGRTCSVSEDYAVRVLCLPLYNDLAHDDVKRIASIVAKNC